MKKRYVQYLLIIGIVSVFFMGCGARNEKVANSTKEVSESTKENEVTPTMEAVATPEPTVLRDGSRNNPFIVGEGGKASFYGYAIQENGILDYKVVKYDGEIVTFKYTLEKYGKSNPLTFNTEMDYDYFENNNMVYVYVTDDPLTFSVSDSDSINAMQKVRIGCGKTKKVKYKVGNAKYLAFVYYTLSEDGGEKDFVDNNDLYGHISFYELKGE